MGRSALRFGAGVGAIAGLLLVLVILVSQPGILDKVGSLDQVLPFSSRGNVAFALAPGLFIDHGDPLISDDHLDFMDRGRYAFQDMVCGIGCGGGLVNVVHGNLIYTRQDISIPGRGLPLEVRFTYNSGSFFDGRYGYGWQMNYNMRYVTNNINGNVIVVREDDRTDIFVKQADGSFQPTYGVQDTLEEYTPGQYVLTDRDGTQYWFESGVHHYLTKIEDRNGNTLILAYNDRELTSVTDNAGRKLTFAYSNNRLATITDPAGRTFRYEYDAAGNLVKVIDPLSNTTQYAYSGDCHDLMTITDARGNALNISYNADYQVEEVATCCGSFRLAYDLTGQETTVTDGNGHSTTYRYDALKRVTAIQDALGQTTTRMWDANYNLTSVTDAAGQTTYAYDSLNRLVSVTDAQGSMTTYTYPSASSLLAGAGPDSGRAVQNQVTSISDANGNTTYYEYDANGNLTKVTDALANITTYSYDSYGQVAGRTDARGNTTQYQYDTHGDLIQVTDASGGGVGYSYDPVGNRISETAADGNVTQYEYDSLNRLVVISDALGYTVEYSYDSVGNRISETDANNNVTQYEYDSLNRLVVISDALACTVDYSYDPVGNRISETDANGHTIEYEYDSLNRLVVISDALDYNIGYSYDPVGNRISETDANGNTTSYSYDPVGNRISETDANGHTINYSYDPVGNRISETDANGHVTNYEYDSLNRLIRVHDPVALMAVDAPQAVTNYSYDPVGNRISETDANGHTIEYEYDSLNRLVVMTDAMGYTTTYTFDPVGNQIGKTDANGHQWQYEYDALGRCIKGISPMSHETTYTYDGVGNRLSRTDPNGATTNYTYDELDRLVKITYPAGHAVDYEYDCVGNTLAVTKTGGLGEIINRTYDANNRLTAETIDYALFTKGVSYSYDGVGNLLTLTDPDNKTIQYEYDEANQLIKVTAPSGMATMAYDPEGNRTELHYPNGLWTAYGYDEVNRVTNITTRNGANIVQFQYDYVYDPAGRLLRIDENGLQEAEFEYDPVGRVTHAEYTSAGKDIHYTYDPVGNRLTADDAGALTTYTYDAEDRVVTQSWTLPMPNVITYSHDSNGNVIGTDSWTFHPIQYEYDYENRLIGFLNPLSPLEATHIFYSAEGHRLFRDEQAQMTYFYPTLMGVVVEMDGGGTTTTRFNPGISMGPPGALVEAGMQATPEASIHYDGRGSTTNFSNASGGTVASFGFGYFGEMLGGSGDKTGVEPGLYATDMKADWDPMLGWELIGGDYAPDIDQHFGAYMFDPGEHGGREYDPYYTAWYIDSGWVGSDPFDWTIGDKGKPRPPVPQPNKKEEKCTHGCYGAAWGRKYVEWKGEYKFKWTCRQQDYLDACRNAEPKAKAKGDEDCAYWDGPACECKGKYGSTREFDWLKQKQGEGWICLCLRSYSGECVEKKK